MTETYGANITSGLSYLEVVPNGKKLEYLRGKKGWWEGGEFHRVHLGRGGTRTACTEQQTTHALTSAARGPAEPLKGVGLAGSKRQRTKGVESVGLRVDTGGGERGARPHNFAGQIDRGQERRFGNLISL